MSIYLAVDCVEGDIRLVGGQGPYEGTVQLCISGEWGTICDDIWGSSNAQVVCNQLGFNYSGKDSSLDHECINHFSNVL